MIRITLPSEFTLPETCNVLDFTVLSPSATCSITTDLILITDKLASGYDPESDGPITFTIDSVLMPKSSAPTGVFRFETQVISQYDCIAYTVDRMSDNNLLTATYGDLLSVSVTPEVTVAFTETKYTFELVPSHDILKNGKIIIQIPDENRILNPTVTRNEFEVISGLSVDAYASVGDVITIHNGFPVDDFPAGSLVSFSLGHIMNPISLQQTSTFKIYTAQADGIYFLDGRTEGVTIQMETTRELTSVDVSPLSFLNSDPNTSISVTMVASSPINSGDQIHMTLPAELALTDLACSGETALQVDLDCSLIDGVIILEVQP